MQQEDIDEFKEMWTTQRDSYVITDDRKILPNGRQMGYGIFQIFEGQLCAVIIEKSEIKEYVSQRMLEAGVRVVANIKEALALARTQVDKPDININGAMGKTA